MSTHPEHCRPIDPSVPTLTRRSRGAVAARVCLALVALIGTFAALAAPAWAQVALNVVVTGPGGLTLANAQASRIGTCDSGQPCGFQFNPGTVVILAPTLTGTNIFNGFSGACAGTPPGRTCRLTLTSPLTNVSMDFRAGINVQIVKRDGSFLDPPLPPGTPAQTFTEMSLGCPSGFRPIGGGFTRQGQSNLLELTASYPSNDLVWTLGFTRAIGAPANVVDFFTIYAICVNVDAFGPGGIVRVSNTSSYGANRATPLRVRTNRTDVACPADMFALGGFSNGTRAFNGPSGVFRTFASRGQASPVNGWFVRNDEQGAGSLTAWAVCGRRRPNLIVTPIGAQLHAPVRISEYSNQVNCPAGFLAISGGYDFNNGDIQPLDNFPISPSSWSVKLNKTTPVTLDWSMDTYCLRP